MQKRIPHYIDGVLVGSYSLNEKPRFKTLKEVIEQRKRAEQGARIVRILNK